MNRCRIADDADVARIEALPYARFMAECSEPDEYDYRIDPAAS